ncbi:Sir2 family NAD-dependent protein deacetylase [Ornithinimicrobium cerasi]|uniref:NAD-dependent protein deacetylase n=1 Tax=Ornithinimicrobium cerasi TaxID=2248773 RepID=A0A285VEA5_9MICO|nr:Sir2 family NAD-dependent protein deacetylase [Ornithinimicrobium cerasi]SOC52419.1 NAD-dependent protein deacetylase, SIR2 family [Ornithinimicrobium cerasi]
MSAGPVPLEHTMPPRSDVDEQGYAVLRRLVGDGGVVALTGAGMSTASGIPDYRGPDGRRRVQPMQHGEFVGSAEARQRYWARAFAGWTGFSAARPNAAHVAVARLQEAGLLEGIVTQNVDGLHQRAGAEEVLELHGSLDRVTCLDCGEPVSRAHVQEWLDVANPGFLARTATSGEVRPDGDVVIDPGAVRLFRAPRCLVCGGDRLKPDVVFFGGSVPRAVVEQAFAMVEDASTLVVLGSSLRVMSGYRFVRRAARLGIPVAVVTRGETRGEGEPLVHLDSLLGDVLPRLVEDLLGP